jgi:predicted nucleotidyltransferase
MRKSSPILAPLFTPIMQGILAATILQEREWYLSDLAENLHVGPSSLQKPLANLLSAGILLKRQDGNRIYYRMDPACPILGELKGILTKTNGIAEPLREALVPLAEKILVAFIHGSVAEDRERSGSDIDLIVIGDVPGPDLTFAVRPLQDALGREINTTRYTVREFEAKLKAKHHFLLQVLSKPRIFLIGSEHELEKITGRGSSVRPADKQARD